MYSQDQRDNFYKAYVGILRRAPEELQEKWDEMVAWTEGSRQPFLHINVAFLPDALRTELSDLLGQLKHPAAGIPTGKEKEMAVSS